MAVNKDIVLATGILVICIVVMGFAFTEPSQDPSVASGVSSGASGESTDVPSPVTDDPPLLAENIVGPGQPLDPPGLPGESDFSSENLGAPSDWEDSSDPIEIPSDLGPTGSETQPVVVSNGDLLFAEPVYNDVDPLDIPDLAIEPSEIIVEQDPLFADPIVSQPVAIPPSRREQEVGLPSLLVLDSTPAARSTVRTHRVASGEIMGAISKQYYGSTRYWREIRDANPEIDPNNMNVGDILTIPVIETAEVQRVAASTANVQELTQASGTRTYTVRRNDSYYVIAQRELGDASRHPEIQELNGIDSGDLKVGTVLKLPAAQRVLATPSAGQTVQAAPGQQVHTVGKGDILGKISQKYYGTSTKWRLIRDANPNVDPESLKIGTKLIIPQSAQISARPTSRTLTAVPTGARTYTIASGDYLQDVALKEYGTVQAVKDILTANPGLKPNRLRVGQVIVLPRRSGTSTTTRSTNTRRAPVDPLDELPDL